MRISASILALTTALSFGGAAFAQDKNVKIGVLTDMAGLYADVGGVGSTVAAQMAIEDSGLAAKGWKIDVVSADHQNKPDVGVNISRQWADQDKVDGIFDVLTSSVALAVAGVAKDKNLVYMNSGAAASDLTNSACTPNTVHWTYDTYLLANGTGKAVTKAGGDTWFFLTADYAFGAALERDTTAVVVANGGKILGGVKHPLSNSDFSSFLLQAQASKAKVIGLANAGGDTTNAIKQAAEFGITAGVGYWGALVLSPVIVGAFGIFLERTMLHRLANLDHLYGLLLTFGLALIIQGVFQNFFGSSGLPYAIPPQLTGAQNLGFMFLPNYRAWVVVCSIVICFATWFAIEKTQLGALLRAATENPALVRAFGINVPRMITLTYGFGVGLAALAGVLAAPINQVRPLMGADLIIVVFAVVVIGGMGSILGSILTGFALGIVEGMTKYFYPEASNTVVFVIMAIVLMVKPNGRFGRAS